MPRSLAFILLLMASMVAFGADQPVRIALNNWSSQLVLSHIYGQLLQQQGVKIEYVPTDVDEQWGALGHGVIHVQVEVWEGTMKKPFDRLVSLGRIKDMGTYRAKTREEWWYPKYVEDVCPGLPDWKALLNCSEQFAPSQGEAGIYISGPWEKPDKARIRALGLNFEVKVVPSGDDLWVALAQAYTRKTPIVLFNWTPNWVESQYDGAFVEFPEYHSDCESDPAWGINPNFLHDCGNPKGGWLKKAAWSQLSSISSCADGILNRMDLNNIQISRMAALIDVDKLGYAEAAKKWIKNHANVWKDWVAGCK